MTSRLTANYKKVCATNEHNYDSSEEKEAYKGLIANSDESSEEDFGDDKEAKIASMRAKLLGEDIDFTQTGKNKGEKRIDGLNVQFGIGFDGDIAETLANEKAEKKSKKEMTDFEKWQTKKADKKRSKKLQ
jgi:hypothetical protein